MVFNISRIDPQIDFENAGYPLTADPFPLWFLNDKDRFTGGGETVDRTALPFTATWQTHLRVPAGRTSVTLSGNQDARVRFALDGNEVATGGMPITVRLPERRGTTIPITIRYEAGTGTDRHIALEWTDDPKTALPANILYAHPANAAQIARDIFLGTANTGILFLASVLAIAYILTSLRGAQWKAWIRSNRFVFLILFLAGLAISTHGLVAAAQSRYFNVLPAGNDPILYETFARHIAATGDWMMTAYEKDSYYWQILYYHLIAVAHVVLGEAIFPVLFIQNIALIGTALLTVKIGQIATGTRTPLLYVAGIAVFFHPLAREYTAQLYPIGAFLAVLSVFMLFAAEKRLLESEKKGLFWGAGATFGLLVLMRSNMELFVPLAIAWIAISLKRRSFFPILLFMIGYAIVLAPFVARNVAVGGKFELFLRSSGTSSLILGTPVPETFVPEKPLPSIIAGIADHFVDGRATRTIQWMHERPGEYLRFLARKIAAFLGIAPFGLSTALTFAAFAIGSAACLIRPVIKRKDWFLMGGFVITQIVGLAVTSVGFARYLVPFVPFALLVAILPFVALKRKRALS